MAYPTCDNCGGPIPTGLRLDCTHGDYCSIDCMTARAEGLGVSG